jgi:V/A-type H+-transporting ATPase subunit I
MAIAPVQKVLIAIHKSEEQAFLKELQKLAIIHITQTQIVEETVQKQIAEDILTEINSAIEYLTEFHEKKSIIGNLLSTKTPVTRQEFEKLSSTYNLNSILQEIKSIQIKLQGLLQAKKNLEDELRFLLPWKNLNYKVKDFYQLKSLIFYAGIFHNSEDINQVKLKSQEYPVHIELISEIDGNFYVIVLYPKELENLIKPIFESLEIVDLGKYESTPAEVLDNIKEELYKLENEIAILKERLKPYLSEIPKLQILYDYYNNLFIQEKIASLLVQTKEALFIEGWIKQKDLSKLKELSRRFATMAYTILPEKKTETMPVALENRKLFQPFEMILELYTMPQPDELDPTPFLAPFFALFFGLCLTDAGYGIVLLVISLLLLKKLKTSPKFLKLLAICGIFTIFAGAMTGSWFGNLFDQLGFHPLQKLKERLTLFDPIKNPLPFFYLSLALGYVHLNYGIFIEIYDLIRQKKFISAILDQFPWVVLVNGLAIYGIAGSYLSITFKIIICFLLTVAITLIVTFTRRNQESFVSQMFWGGVFLGGLTYLLVEINLYPINSQIFKLVACILIYCGLWALIVLTFKNQWLIKKRRMAISMLSALLFIIFLTTQIFHFPIFWFIGYALTVLLLDHHNRRQLKNFIWGLYNLYGGTNFLGVVLSYIRLMALGMVTGGIALAINTIAWMVIKIPLIGIFFGLIVLLFGHFYNLLINILGAFVHSLRLNYVEFFPRFFTGGGEKFSPFSEETKYITIKEEVL